MGDLEPGMQTHPTIVAIGVATTAVEADRARVRLDLDSKDMDLKEATKSLSAGVQEISRKAREIGLTEDQIESSGIRVVPAWPQESEGTVDAIFSTEVQVLLTFTDITKVHPFLIEVLRTKNIGSFDVQYINTEEAALRAKTREAAILNAQEKAEAAAVNLNGSVGRVVSFKSMSDDPMESLEAASGMNVGMGGVPAGPGFDPKATGQSQTGSKVVGPEEMLPSMAGASKTQSFMPAISLPGEFSKVPWKLSFSEMITVTYELVN